jgi:hypothetical protein
MLIWKNYLPDLERNLVVKDKVAQLHPKRKQGIEAV